MNDKQGGVVSTNKQTIGFERGREIFIPSGKGQIISNTDKVTAIKILGSLYSSSKRLPINFFPKGYGAKVINDGENYLVDTYQNNVRLLHEKDVLLAQSGWAFEIGDIVNIKPSDIQCIIREVRRPKIEQYGRFNYILKIDCSEMSRLRELLTFKTIRKNASIPEYTK